MSTREAELVATELVDSCIVVHRELGSGLLESVYQVCLTDVLQERGFEVRCEVGIPVQFRDKQLDTGFRVDMIIDDVVLVENKSVQAILPVHEAQLLTYLRLSNIQIGFLINWNVVLIKDGLRRMILSR